MKKIEKVIEKYSLYIANHPDLAEAIGTLIEDHQNIKIREKENQELKSILAHELKGPLVSIGGFVKLLEKKDLPQEKRDKFFDIIKYSVSQMSDLTKLLYLSGCSKEELKENSEKIILEEIASTYASTHDSHMIDEKIGLDLKSERFGKEHLPIEFYADKSVINAMWGTLLGNSLSWTPKNSRISQGIGINKLGNLEILMENKYSNEKIREFTGMGKGKGLPFVEKIVQNLGGNFSKYHSPQVGNNYTSQEKWGYDKAKNVGKKSKVYGIKITIPMGELTKN